MSDDELAHDDRRAHQRYRIRDYIPAELAPPTGDGLIGYAVFMHDVSASGVGFAAADDLGLQVGSTFDLMFAGRRSPVRVRHIGPVEDGWVNCGATFVDVLPEVLAPLQDALHGRPNLDPLPLDRADALAIHFEPQD